jgi:hypothetical protein
MQITDWPVNERSRGKLTRQGASSLSDAELLAIFLQTEARGKNAIDLARELLLEFGSLRPMLEAACSRFKKARGLGNAKYAQLNAVLEMTKRHLEESIERGVPLTSPAQCLDYLVARLRNYPREVFACLFLDNQPRVLKFEELFHGTIDNNRLSTRCDQKSPRAERSSPYSCPLPTITHRAVYAPAKQTSPSPERWLKSVFSTISSSAMARFIRLQSTGSFRPAAKLITDKGRQQTGNVPRQAQAWDRSKSRTGPASESSVTGGRPSTAAEAVIFHFAFR